MNNTWGSRPEMRIKRTTKCPHEGFRSIEKVLVSVVYSVIIDIHSINLFVDILVIAIRVTLYDHIVYSGRLNLED